MSDELDKLEQTVEQEMKLLTGLPSVAPRPECLARIKVAVVAEAQRQARRQRVVRWTGAGVGVAAVVALVVGLMFFERPAAHRPASDPGKAFNEWAAAVDESTAHFAKLLAGGGSSATVSDEEGSQIDELFQGLDESLQHFANLESG